MDIYKEVSDRIIAQLENGVIPWQKPWIASNQAISRSTGKPYSLLNQMLLGMPGFCADRFLSASIIRESSPPDATRASGFIG